MTRRASNIIWAVLWTLFILLLLYSGVLVAGIIIYGDAEEAPDLQPSVFGDEDAYTTVLAEEIPEDEWKSYGISKKALAAYKLTPQVFTYDEDGASSLVSVGGYAWAYEWCSYNLQGKSEYDGDISAARDFGGEIWNEEENPVSNYMEFYVGGEKVGDDGYVGEAEGEWWLDGNPVPETIAVCYEPFGTPINFRLSIWDWGGGQATMTVRFDYAAKPSAEEFTVYSGNSEEEEIIFKARYDDFEETFTVDPSSYGEYEGEDYLYCSFEIASLDDSKIRTEITKREYTTGTVCVEPDKEDEWSMGISYNGATAVSGGKKVSWRALSNALFDTEDGFKDIPTTLLNYSACRHFDRSQTKTDGTVQSDASPMMTLTFRHETDDGTDVRFSIGLSFCDYDAILVGAGGIGFVDQDGNPVTDIIIGA